MIVPRSDRLRRPSFSGSAFAGLLALLLPSVLLADPSFDPPITGAVGNEPRHVATGDLDDDGLPDLLVTSRYESSVSVLLALGDGSYGARSLYDIGSFQGPMAMGDMDKDGHLDVVVGRTSLDDLALMKGDGHGGLAWVSSPKTGLYPVAIAIGDVNADGWPDLVTSNPGTLHCCHSVAVLIGTGGGTFEVPKKQPATRDMLPVALGDFSEDGALDIVAGIQPGIVRLYPGNGDGTFQAYTDIVLSNYVNDVEVADLNEDGHEDLVIAGWPTSVLYLAGNGDGTFAPKVLLMPGSSRAVAVADFDRDGHLDVATGVSDTAVIVHGNGDGTFGQFTYVRCGGILNDVHAADMNDDGIPDLVVLYGSTVAVLLNRTTPTAVGPARPGAALALEGLRPNPAIRELRVEFTLASAAPAALELLDASGRRFMNREVGSMGPGRHRITVDLGSHLSPGVYWLRLRQGLEMRTTRAVVLR